MTDKFGLIKETRDSLTFVKGKRGKTRMLAFATALRLQKRMQRQAPRGVVYILARFTENP